MIAAKADIIPQLRRDILLRHGAEKTAADTAMQVSLGSINHAFFDHRFPVGAVHEFICDKDEDKAATTGFIAGILSALMKAGGITLWVAASPLIFPPALVSFGIQPDRIIFVDLQRGKDLLWMIEESLRCDSLTAVVGEISRLDFTASRRLQLAVEQSRVTGFLIRQTRHLHTTACVSRWKITGAPGYAPGGLPGIGFPRWNVELCKIRNGKPGNWLMEWCGNSFREVLEHAGSLQQPLITKTA